MRAVAAISLFALASAVPNQRRLQASSASAFAVTTNGASVDASIDTAAAQRWFSFHGQAGYTYQIETVLGSLTDTMVDLVDTDSSTVIVENDDDDRDPNSYASFIEWTCPADGTYYVMVKGYGRATGSFAVMVTEGAGGTGGVAGGDPCQGGVILTAPSAQISFQPDGNYGDDASCTWMIQCPNAQPATVTFSQFLTEADYDFVNIHDGTAECAVSDRGTCSDGSADVWHASGGMQDIQGNTIVHGTSANTVIQFTSDASVTDGGFVVDYICGRAPPPPTPPTPPPPAPPAVMPGGQASPLPLTMGQPNRGEIVASGDHVWYSFMATSGDSFSFEVDINPADSFTLSDSVMDIVDKDRASVMVENDDDSRGGGSLASYAEWTAPDTGMYFIMVKAYATETGTFGLVGNLLGGAGGPDPCTAPGVVMGQAAASITYMPDGDYADRSTCTWTVTCPPRSGMVHVSVDQLDTESGWDFVNLYDGRDNTATKLDGLSGDVINLATTEYYSSTDSMTVEFTSDGSVTGGGFMLHYVCAPPPPPVPPPTPPPTPPPPVGPPPPPHVVDTGHQDDFILTTDGTATPGEVLMDGDQEWYQFVAVAGVTYGFETLLVGIDDTIMDLVDTDRSTVIIENDDDNRDGANSFASYIEWTCPSDGTYYVMIKGYGSSTGTFTLTASSSAAGGGSNGPTDPCTAPGSMLTGNAASISYEPNGLTLDNQDCMWTITCPAAGTMPTITFNRFDTESNFDFVNVFDGAGTSPAMSMGTMSGSLADLPSDTMTPTGGSMTLEFTSDGSVGGIGFDATYECRGVQAPPPPTPPPPPPPTGGVAVSTTHLINSDGAVMRGEIVHGTDHEWYQFDAIAAHTYQVETSLDGIQDTVMDLVDTDRSTVIVENDDDDRAGANSYASYIEWTCPSDGTYYVMIKGFGPSDIGTYNIQITDTSTAGGIVDPCDATAGGAMMTGQGTLSFQPNGNYVDNSVCDWHIQCARGAATLEFTSFSTEQDYDFVDILDGPTATSASLGHLTGSLVDMRQSVFTSSSSSMTVHFTSDESVTDGGFEATYGCR